MVHPPKSHGHNESKPSLFLSCPLPTARIVRSRQWCDMMPCLEDEGCDLLVNQSGWTCTQPGGRVKTTTAL
uniref:Protein FAM19A5 n=1 Tax=Oncorhynchus mykiss TaxID=8022 RepID=A0A8L0DUW1_ONCMY